MPRPRSRLRRRARLLCTVPLLLLLAAPAVAPASEGALSPGRSWPIGRIRVFNAVASQQAAVDAAMAAWNGVGARVRFVGTRVRTRAHVVVRNDPAVPVRYCGTGFGSIGYPGPGGVAEVRIRTGPASAGQTCAWPGQTLVIAHELGHVLGLGHELAKCSIMNTRLTVGRAPALCVPLTRSAADVYALRDLFGRWRCGLIEAVDARRIVARYGGRVVPRTADPWCDLYAPIGAPAVTAAVEPTAPGPGAPGPAVRIELVRPADPVLPSFIAQDASLTVQPTLRNTYLLYRSAGTCLMERPRHPFEPPAGTSLVTPGGWTVAPGAAQVVSDTGASAAGPGVALAGATWCWTAWAWDPAGRPGAAAATAPLTVAATIS